VPSVDVHDETFLAVGQRALAEVFADQERCRRFWPDLRLTVYADRGDKGLRWTVRGALVGTMEVWLEPVLDGTVLHYFLRADACDSRGQPSPLSGRAALAEIGRRQLAAKALAFELKDELEAGRPAGEPPPPDRTHTHTAPTHTRARVPATRLTVSRGRPTNVSQATWGDHRDATSAASDSS